MVRYIKCHNKLFDIWEKKNKFNCSDTFKNFPVIHWWDSGKQWILISSLRIYYPQYGRNKWGTASFGCATSQIAYANHNWQEISTLFRVSVFGCLPNNWLKFDQPLVYSILSLTNARNVRVYVEQLFQLNTLWLYFLCKESFFFSGKLCLVRF